MAGLLGALKAGGGGALRTCWDGVGVWAQGWGQRKAWHTPSVAIQPRPTCRPTVYPHPYPLPHPAPQAALAADAASSKQAQEEEDLEKLLAM